MNAKEPALPTKIIQVLADETPHRKEALWTAYHSNESVRNQINALRDGHASEADVDNLRADICLVLLGEDP